MPNLLIGAIASLLLVGVATGNAGEETSSGNTPQQAALVMSTPSATSFAIWQLNADEQRRLAEVLPLERAFADTERLTPYEILGKHARSETERLGYARRYLEASIAHQRRSLDWAIALAGEIGKIESRTSPFMTPTVEAYLASIGYKGRVAGSSDPASSLPVSAETAKRLQAFVQLDTCPSCATMFDAALRTVLSGRYEGVDVIFVGMEREDRQAATEWALSRGITAAMVDARTVTLNTETRAWQAVRAGRAAPLVIDAHSGAVHESP